MNLLEQASSFLIDTIFDIFIFILALRLLLQMAHADYFNPVVKMVIKLTQWLVRPFQFILPQVFNIDLAIIFSMILVEIINVLLLSSIIENNWPNWAGVILWIFGDIINKFLLLWFYATLLRAILSWILPHQHHVLSTVLMQLTEPLLKPVRKLVPHFHGFDFSPIIVLIFLQLLRIILVLPLIETATKLAYQ